MALEYHRKSCSAILRLLPEEKGCTCVRSPGSSLFSRTGIDSPIDSSCNDRGLKSSKSLFETQQHLPCKH